VSNCTVVSKSAKQHQKPTKPYDGFPLTVHPSKRWCKKINGKTYYFGSWADGWESALATFEQQRDYLYRGVKPPRADGLTIKAACNEFLNAKRALVDSGELSVRSWADYKITCQRVSKVFGPGRMVEDLRPDDFVKLRAALAKGKTKTRGPVSVSNDIGRCRTLFKFCSDSELIASPVRFGVAFNKPSKKTIRQERQRKGRRAFTAAEVRKLLAAAPLALRAMILLGLNCGFGQSDLSSLPRDAVDLERGWIVYPRPKTGADRRCPLWVSTQLAMREWLSQCPRAKDAEDAGVVFITRCGARWCKTDPLTGGSYDAISKEFDKLLIRLGIKRPGLAFYALRHSFRTVADETLDQPATRLIMGHIDAGIDDQYREHIADARLQRVVDYVHEWLYPSPKVEVSN
jgi:integrase